MRLGGNKEGRDRDAPWKPIALEGGRDRVVLSRWEGAETRSIVDGFDRKRRDRKGVSGSLATRRVGGKAASKRIKRLLPLPMVGFASVSVVCRCRS